MNIFIDDDYRCYATDRGGLRKIECDDFDGYCDAFIEGHRYVPYGETWVNEKGIRFVGKMVAPWKPYAELEQAQREYERELAQAARILLGEV